MSLYLDTSCFLKLLFFEPDTAAVARLTAGESQVVVSGLTRVEALIQIAGREVGRAILRRDAAFARRSLSSLLETPPFEQAEVPAPILRIAEQQVRSSAGKAHCRTLDRLHLAVMESLGLRRLFTNDDQQAAAARALGFDVILPR